jgi:response regulator RpfG family c-di-GMP phosphodiesterase
MSEKIKILYVDDEEINTQVFKISFSVSFQVLVAYNGQEGLELLQRDPDIKFVISDMKMPQMNGLEFIREIKKKNPKIPCMLLSGYQQTPEIMEALNQEVIIAYMMKPFNKGEIERLIHEYTS